MIPNAWDRERRAVWSRLGHAQTPPPPPPPPPLVGALHSGFIRGALKRRQRSGGSSLAKQTDREPTATDTATMLGLAVSMALDCVYSVFESFEDNAA